MYAPKEIIDFLESILGIYLSDIRHKERSVFILCDNLIEICCKTRILEKTPIDSQKRDFHNSLKDAKIPRQLFRELDKRHKIRNDMQHSRLGITVDNQDCACAILGVKKALQKLWGRYSLSNAPDWVSCALRIVELYSNSSNHLKIKSFENKLLKDMDWSIEEVRTVDREGRNSVITGRRFPNSNEMIIEVGAKNYWVLLVREKTQLVNQCLDELKN